jgi:hypothetical protein
MADHSSRAKGTLREFWPYQQCGDKRRRPLAGERHILELISLGAPLPGILNRLCAAIDVRIGNVVSLFLLPDGDADDSCSANQSALQVGLQIFSSTDIFANDETFLGTLEIYGCDPRRPTAREVLLIERVVRLATIALRRREYGEGFDGSSRRSKSSMDDESERPPFIN